MEKEYLEQLPENVALLAREIEDFSGREIQVIPNPNPISPTDPNPNALACSVNELTAKIFYRQQEINPHGFTHELLHIHRYWLRQIPQILPVSDPTGTNIQVTSEIENSIEHLIIVPEEAQYGFEPYGHWNYTSRQNWEKFDPSNMNKFAIRKNCLLGWLTEANLVNDPDVISIAEEVIKSHGFLQKAKQLNTKVIKYANSKERQLSCVVKFLRIPRGEVKLVYLDVKNGTRVERAIEKFRD